MEDYKELMKQAKRISKNAYAKYSKFCLGAALLTKSGNIYTGVNVENGSFGLTNCAERTAFFSAISSGEKTFKAIAIYIDSEKMFTPCGACRQVMAEFCSEDFKIIYFNKTDKTVQTTLGELLPHSFKL